MAAELLDIAGLKERTTPLFRYELWRQATAAQLDPSLIAAVMRIESNFDPNVPNRGGAPALGLIQFWKDFFPPIVARAAQSRPELADTAWEDLRSLSAVNQLPFVIAYFQGVPKMKLATRPVDYYLAVFLPALIGAPSDKVIGVKDSKESLDNTGLSLGKLYAQNTSLDADKDGMIRVRDLESIVGGIVNPARARARIPVDLPEDQTDPLIATAGLGSGSGYVLLLVPAFFFQGGFSVGADGVESCTVRLRRCVHADCAKIGTIVDPSGRSWCASHFSVGVL